MSLVFTLDPLPRTRRRVTRTIIRWLYLKRLDLIHGVLLIFASQNVTFPVF